MNYILKNARVIDPSTDFDGVKDIYVTDGKFAAEAAADAETIDLKG